MFFVFKWEMSIIVLLDHMGILIFWEMFILLSIQIEFANVPINNRWGLFSLQPCQHWLFQIFVLCNVLTDVRLYLLAVLICISVSWWAIFHMSVGHLYVFFWKCPFLHPIYGWGHEVFLLEILLGHWLYSSWINTLSEAVHTNNFFIH